MRFLGLLGKKGNSPSTGLEGLNDALSGAGVTDALWQEILEASEIEDALHEEVPLKQMQSLTARHPKPVFDLCLRCVQAIEGALPSRSSTTKKPSALADKVEGVITNSAAVLTHILAAGPTRLDTRKGVLDALWAVPASGGLSVGARAINATLELLFIDGFTTWLPSEDDEVPDNINGVEPGVLWLEGVGPEGGSEKMDANMRGNRQKGLRLLAAILCGGAPTNPPQTAEDKPGQVDTADKLTPPAAVSLTPLIADARALEYLCNPDRHVPRRGELLYSLMSVVLAHDPHGMSVPYAGYFTGKEPEQFVQLCLQVLGLLLQFGEDAVNDVQSATFKFRPQERPGVSCSEVEPGKHPQVFRRMLAEISSERELTFIVDGIITLFGTVGEERSSYLPKSVRLPSFLTELLVLVFHLSMCKDFVLVACREDDVAQLIEALFEVVHKAPTVPEEPIALLTWATLMRLTSYREVCLACNDDDRGDDTADSEGSLLDTIFECALEQLGEYFLVTKVDTIRWATMEASVATLINLSTFTEELALGTTVKFWAFVERCLKSSQGRRSRGCAYWLSPLFECVENIVYYQYFGNQHLAYGMATRFAALKELRAIAAAAAETPEAGANAEASATCKSPRSDDSRMSKDLLCASWGKELQARLDPMMSMLEVIVPELEAQVAKSETTTPHEAKGFLPRNLFGLLPLPPMFVTRGLGYNISTHRACEQCLVACFVHGPIADIWELCDDGESGSADEEEPTSPENIQDAEDSVQQDRPKPPPPDAVLSAVAS